MEQVEGEASKSMILKNVVTPKNMVLSKEIFQYLSLNPKEEKLTTDLLENINNTGKARLDGIEICIKEIETIKSRYYECQKNIKEAKDNLKSEKNQSALLQNEISRIIEEIKKNEVQKKNKEKQLCEIKRKVNDTETEILKISNDIKLMQIVFNTKNSECKNIKNDLETIEKYNNEMKIKIKEMKDEKIELENNLSRLNRSILRTKYKKIATYKKFIDDLLDVETKNQEIEKKIRIQKENLLKKQEENEKEKILYENLVKKKKELEIDYQKENSDYKKLINDKNDLVKKINEIENDIYQLNNKLSQFGNEKDELNEKKQALNEELFKKESENKLLRLAIDNLTEEISGLKDINNKLINDKKNQEEMKKKLDSEIAENKIVIDEKEKQINSNKDLKSKLLEQNEKIEKSIADKRNEISKNNEVFNSYKETNDEIIESIKGARQQKIDLEKRLSELNETNSSLTKKIGSLEKSISDMKEQDNKYQKEISEKKVELEKANTKIDELNKKITSAKEAKSLKVEEYNQSTEQFKNDILMAQKNEFETCCMYNEMCTQFNKNIDVKKSHLQALNEELERTEVLKSEAKEKIRMLRQNALDSLEKLVDENYVRPKDHTPEIKKDLEAKILCQRASHEKTMADMRKTLNDEIIEYIGNAPQDEVIISKLCNENENLEIARNAAKAAEKANDLLKDSLERLKPQMNEISDDSQNRLRDEAEMTVALFKDNLYRMVEFLRPFGKLLSATGLTEEMNENVLLYPKVLSCIVRDLGNQMDNVGEATNETKLPKK